MVGEIKLMVLFGNMQIDIERRNNMDYNKITLEECFVYYHTGKTVCECNADKEEIIFSKE
jgi:hypothetical protein